MSEQNEIQKELEILWSPQQVATYLGLTRGAVYKWIAEKRMIDPNRIVRVGSRVRIPRSEVVRIAGLTRAKLQGEDLQP